MIWHERIAESAAAWLSGVTPAQQEASTEMRTSGIIAFSSSALEITQMSVHSPTISSSMGSVSDRVFRSSASRTLPKAGFS